MRRVVEIQGGDKFITYHVQFRSPFEGDVEYAGGAKKIWKRSVIGLGVAAGLSMTTMYCYTAIAYSSTMPLVILGINTGGWVAAGLLQLTSYDLRKTSIVKAWTVYSKSGILIDKASILVDPASDKNDKRAQKRAKEFAGLSTVECLFGYYAAAASLALGHYCASIIAGGALSLELAAAAGAVTGAVIAIPSLLFGPTAHLQGNTPSIIDIITSAGAGATALMAAQRVSELFFPHMGMALDTLKPEMAFLMNASIALPIFAAIKIFTSMIYEGCLTSVAHSVLSNTQYVSRGTGHDTIPPTPSDWTGGKYNGPALYVPDHSMEALAVRNLGRPAMREARRNFEGEDRYNGFREAVWAVGVLGIGVAAGCTMVGMYCNAAALYTITYGPATLGMVFGLNAGTWVLTGLLQLASYHAREGSLVKQQAPLNQKAEMAKDAAAKEYVQAIKELAEKERVEKAKAVKGKGEKEKKAKQGQAGDNGKMIQELREQVSLTRLQLNKATAKVSKSTHDDSRLYSFLEFTCGYYAAAALLAAGYYCISLVVGGALSFEVAAISGAIIGGLIALPSLFFGPSARLQGHNPHFVDIVSSAVAGAVTFVVAKLASELFFTSIGIAEAPAEMAFLMHASIALPVFATVKILLSLFYEGCLSLSDIGHGSPAGEQQGEETAPAPERNWRDRSNNALGGRFIGRGVGGESDYDADDDMVLGRNRPNHTPHNRNLWTLDEW